MRVVEVRARVESELKRETIAVPRVSGLDVSTALRLFLRGVSDIGFDAL